MNESLEFLNYINNPNHWYLSERGQIGEGTQDSITMESYKGICIESFCSVPVTEQLLAFDTIFNRCDLRGITVAQLIHGTKDMVRYYYLFTHHQPQSNSTHVEQPACMDCIEKFILDFKLNFNKCNIRILSTVEIQTLLETMEAYSYCSILEGVPGSYTDATKLTPPERILEQLDGEEFMMLLLGSQLDYTVVETIERNLQQALNLLNPLVNQVTIYQTTESMNTAVQAHSNQSSSSSRNCMEGKQRKAIQVDFEGEEFATKLKNMATGDVEIKELQYDLNTMKRSSKDQSCSSGVNTNKSNEQRKVCITNCNTNNICAEGWVTYIKEVMARRLTMNIGAGIFRFIGGILTNSASALQKLECLQLMMYRREKDNKIPLHHHRVDSKHPLMRQIKRCHFPVLSYVNPNAKFSKYEQLGGVLCGQLVTPSLLYGGNWISNRELSALYIIPELFGSNNSNTTLSMQSISTTSEENSKLKGEVTDWMESNFLLIGKKECIKTLENQFHQQTIHYATYMPSNQQVYINPFELYKGELISHRIDLLKSIFGISFHLQSMEVFLLEQAIYDCYKAHGWNFEVNRNIKYEDAVYKKEVRGFPTLGEVLNRIRTRNQTNTTSSLYLKLYSLLYGRKAVVFNQTHSMDIERLCNQKARIELDGIRLNSELRFLIGILGIQLIEYNKNMEFPKKYTVCIPEFHTIFSENECTLDPRLKEHYSILKDYLEEAKSNEIQIVSFT